MPTLRWQRETSPNSNSFVDLDDGPTSSWDGNIPGFGAIISGATTDTLTIAADLAKDLWLSDAHSIRYRCIVSNACGSVTSDPAQLSVCIADYNCDGFTTGEDFDAFVDDFILGLPSADVNHDEFTTGEDFDLYVDRFVAGC